MRVCVAIAFRINVHNVTSLIKCILPYHETALFARVMRLCKLGEEWLFLHNVKKYKVKLDRATLVQNCLKDSHLLTFICELVVRSPMRCHIPSGYRDHDRLSGLPPQTKSGEGKTLHQVSDVHLSLYVATVLELIARTAKVTDDLLHVLLPHILIGATGVQLLEVMAATPMLIVAAGLEAPQHRNLQVASYMIVAQLSTRTAFASKLLNTLMKAITTHTTEGDSLRALSHDN